MDCFNPQDRYCNGFEDVIARYKEIVSQLTLAGKGFQGNCLPIKDIKQRTPEQCVGSPLAKPKTGEKALAYYKWTQSQSYSKSAWLLALEVTMEVMVGALFLIAILTSAHRCKNKSSIIIL